MSAARLITGGIFVGIMFVGGRMWNADSNVVRWSPLDRTTTTVSDPRGAELFDRSDREFIVDRYGNQIEEAVGDYRVDPRGDIFERHSPATAVPRLAAPST